MIDTSAPQGEARLVGLHMAVSGLGFGVDVALLQTCLHFGMAPAWARVVSLACAMQVTFVVNGLHVFRGLGWDRRFVRQWAGYMAANGFGNVCNYWVFVTLVSLHRPVLSLPMAALSAGSVVAWVINYSCTRHIVFGGVGRRIADCLCGRRTIVPALIPVPPDPSPPSPE